MSEKPHEHQDFEQLDEAIGHSTHKLFNMSPNDVLVQISLPVVLILAIATRLITIGQGLTNQSQNPAVLDLWKQHLILRVDRTLDQWEKQSGLPQFTDFGRVYWDHQWPADERLRQLCEKATALANLDKMKEDLYRQSLNCRPDPATQAGESGTSQFVPLYDPRYAQPGVTSNSTPPEFQIDDARRQYAFQYIEERCKRWNREIEELQWKLVDQLAAKLPAGDPLADASVEVQMKNIAEALETRGYPLLPGITHEYRKAP
jgi:hypothetical protein